MDQPQRISPNIKAFLNESLPVDASKHVLVAGEMHTQHQPYRFVARHLDELVDEHGLGSICFEAPTMLDIFQWALRDGKLPVVAGKEKAYLTTLHQSASNFAVFNGSSSEEAAVKIEANKRGLECFHYDSRDGAAQDIISKGTPYIQLLDYAFAQYPQLEARIREKPARLAGLADALSVRGLVPQQHLALNQMNMDRFSNQLGRGFFVRDALNLCRANPEYKQLTENIDAVIRAGQQHGIESDALNAALIHHRSTPRNVLAYGGLSHILGNPAPLEELNAQGTLADHLRRMPLSVTTGCIADWPDSQQLKFLLSLGTHHPAAIPWPRGENTIPTMLLTGRDQVIRESDLNESQRFFSMPKVLQGWRDRADPNVKAVRDGEYLGKMHAKLETPEMQEALSKLSPQR